MLVKGEMLRIQGSDYDADTGAKLEPEEKPAERLLVVDGKTTGSLDGRVLGEIPTRVAIQGNVGMFANGLRTMCSMCKHFDQHAWTEMKRRMEGSKEGVQMLNVMRAGMLDTGNARFDNMHQDPDGGVDLEHALSFMGVCRALTEHYREPITVHPIGGCPDEVCTQLAPEGFFQPTDPQQKVANAAYDQIMRNAQNTFSK